MEAQISITSLRSRDALRAEVNRQCSADHSLLSMEHVCTERCTAEVHVEEVHTPGAMTKGEASRRIRDAYANTYPGTTVVWVEPCHPADLVETGEAIRWNAWLQD